MTDDEIRAAMIAERDRQREKWAGLHDWGRGDCSSPYVPTMVKAAVLVEEAGEVMQAVLDAGPGRARADDAVRTEVVQVLAVAHAILEGM